MYLLQLNRNQEKKRERRGVRRALKIRQTTWKIHHHRLRMYLAFSSFMMILWWCQMRVSVYVLMFAGDLPTSFKSINVCFKQIIKCCLYKFHLLFLSLSQSPHSILSSLYLVNIHVWVKIYILYVKSKETNAWRKDMWKAAITVTEAWSWKRRWKHRILFVWKKTTRWHGIII